MRYVVRHIAVKEDEGFDLDVGEMVLSAEYDAPYFHLILLLDGEHIDGSMSLPEDGT